jgi:hypothetical protein
LAGGPSARTVAGEEMTMTTNPDPCPERDHDGYCHCKKYQHERIVVPREPNYPNHP